MTDIKYLQKSKHLHVHLDIHIYLLYKRTNTCFELCNLNLNNKLSGLNCILSDNVNGNFFFGSRATSWPRALTAGGIASFSTIATILASSGLNCPMK